MIVFLIIKCGFVDAYSFISQLACLNEVSKIYVFRNEKSIENQKVNYILPPKFTFNKINIFIRFFQIIFKAKYSPKIIIGIYEIPHGLLALLTSKILRKPNVVSIIGNPAYAKIRKGIRLKLTNWILKNCDNITVTGNYSKNYLIKQGFDSSKIFILPNTLNFEPFNKQNGLKKYDIINIGRICEEKHIENIIYIIAKLKQVIPNIKAGIGGIGPKKEFLVHLAKELDLGLNIDFTGYIPDENLSDFYNSGRIFVLTSETEGFPRTIIQAAACGIPVVSSNVGDISDIIDNGNNGFLINNYNDTETYSQRIYQLLNDEELYNAFSLRLFNKVHSSFNIDEASKVWQKILNK